MKYARSIVVVIVSLLPALANAQLGSSDQIVFQVPFQFMVAGKAVPAGQCIVQSATMDGRTLVIRNIDTRLRLFSQVSLAETKKTADAYSLVFHEYGGQYFLAELRLAGDRTVYELPETNVEAELRAKNVPMTEKVLASRK